MYSQKEIRNARRFLTASNIDKGHRSEQELVTLAFGHGWTLPTNAEPEPMPAPAQAPPAPALDLIGQAINSAIDIALAKHDIKVDDKTIIDLIQKHATKTLKVQHYNKSVKKVTITIDGAHAAFEDVLASLECNLMPYLVGDAGSGKTTLAMQAAKAMDVEFYSTGAVLAAYELLGFKDATGEYKATPLRKCFEHGGLFLFDEIDGCDPQALVAINQLLANELFTFPDGLTVTKHPKFYGVGAANTMGTGATRQYARNPLDMASLDRFVEIKIEYDLKLEDRLAFEAFKQYGGDFDTTLTDWVDRVRGARKAVKAMGALAVISPRASIFGARLLARGMDRTKVDNMVLFKSLSVDQRKQLTAAIGV